VRGSRFHSFVTILVLYPGILVAKAAKPQELGKPMSDATVDPGADVGAGLRQGRRSYRPHLDTKPTIATVIIFLALLAAGILVALYGLTSDIGASATPPLAIGVFALLGIALLIALGFEFVNGFHDTANAVATVIYTHSLPAQPAVIWSGCWNLVGVITSSGAVAFSVITLLPVELILQVGSNAGFAMIFALLIAAMVWNLGTWLLGIPASSSHTLIGSIIGVGIANELMAPTGAATSGVDWSQAIGVFKALLFSPVVGFIFSAVLLIVMKTLVRRKELYEPPDTSHPPPLWIRALLVLTCTGVSFAHGSNDGQKGMGLIMLILIGAVPTAYALNRALPASSTPAFIQAMQQGEQVFGRLAGNQTVTSSMARPLVEDAIRTRNVNQPTVFAGMTRVTQNVADQVGQYGAIAKVPAAAVQNVRNDMYLLSEAVRLMQKQDLTHSEASTLTTFRSALDSGTKFIPLWVKVSVAIALGLGTMVGWKRIVITVGERIGKSHLTYGQGASAEMIAAATIMAADMYGLPVSTTHVLSSGVAGTMAANGSGLQWGTIRSIALAWVLTLPAAIILSATLYYLFRSIA
jgi:inorganic phosphate transporter, PiT family